MHHIEQLRTLLLGAPTPGEVSEVLAHAVGCRLCLAEAESILVLTEGEKRKGARRILQDVLELEQRGVVEMLLADAQWVELQNSAAKAQKEKIATSAICKTLAFTRLLLTELSNSSSWEEAERLASLVAASIHAMDPAEFGGAFKNDLRAETLVELANSRRKAAEWRRADDALAKAASFLAGGTGDRSLQARHLAILASLEADRGQTESAIANFTRCRSLYEEIGAGPLVARTLVQLADTLSERDPRQGLGFLNEADAYLKPGDALVPTAKLLRVDCLIWTGELREAIRWLLSCERPSGGRMLIRYRFIGARLLYSLGHRGEAERLFHEVVTDDIENAFFKDALLDLLYLLKVHLAESDKNKAVGVCRRALGEALLAEFSHEQLKSVWQQVLDAVEKMVFAPEALSSLKHYMSLHWRHPASQPPSFVHSR